MMFCRRSSLCHVAGDGVCGEIVREKIIRTAARQGPVNFSHTKKRESNKYGICVLLHANLDNAKVTEEIDRKSLQSQ